MASTSQLPTGTRAKLYDEQLVHNAMPTEHTIADAGGYFVAGNPTIGTGIQKAASITAFADTNALFVIQNTDSPANLQAKRIYLRFIRLSLGGTAPTGTVSMEWAFKLDKIERFPTTAANMTVLTAVNVNMDSAVASVAKVASYANAGAMTIPAASTAARVAGRAKIPTGLGIVGDEYVVTFGQLDWPGVGGLTAARAAVPARLISNAAPIIIGPGQTLVVHQWWVTAATTVETHEFELGWWER
jgi:hypothetical protein